MIIKWKPITSEVDTGAAVTVISQEVCRKTFPNLRLQSCFVLLKPYTESQAQVQGEAQVDMSYGEQRGKFTLYMIKGSVSCLLSQNWLKHIHLDWKMVVSIAMKGGPNQLV